MPIEFWVLCVFAIGIFVGWIAKVDFDRYKADQEREAQARERRQAYIHSEEFIKSINRNNTFNSWVAEAKGGAVK
jgi:hypothetical protein